MNNYYNLEGIKTELNKRLSYEKSILQAWENVTFPTKKDGTPFKVMSKNFENAKFYNDITAWHDYEKKLKVGNSHCRIKEEEYNRKLLNLCENAKTRTDGKIKYIIVVESYNQGNARYPHSIKKVSMYSVGKFAKETEKTFAGYRKSNILALVK